MVRRLELAQALVNRPSLLILDEPTVGLDPDCPRRRLVAGPAMQDEFGMTVLLTTHYMEEADALCDRVALMHHGVLQAVGSPDDLKADSSSPADPTLEDVFRHYAGSDLDGGRRRSPGSRDPLQQKDGAPCQLSRACHVHLVRAPRGWRRVGRTGRRGWALSRSSSCRSCATTAPNCSPAWCSPRCGC